MNSNIIFIFVFLLSLSSKTLQLIVEPSEVTALQNLNLALFQSWDLTDNQTICSNNQNIQCGPNSLVATHITHITIMLPSTGLTYDLPSDIFQFPELVYLWVDSKNINIPTSFWQGFGVLTQLSLLYLAMVTQPIVITSMPPITEFDILECYATLPVELFAMGNFQFFSIGLENSYDFPVFPSSIPSPSNIQEITTKTWRNLNLDGSKFVNLTSMYLVYAGSFQPSDNTFDTFPKLSSIIISNDITDPVLPYSFPTSILNMPNLETMSYYGEQATTISSLVPFHFISTKLKYIHFERFDLTTLDQSGITISSNDAGISTSFVNLDISKINIFQFTSIDIGTGTVTGNIPSGSYKNMNTLSFTGNGFAGPMPEGLCDIQRSIYMTNTQITSIPACFVCDWGATGQYTNTFQFNNMLPAQTQSCPLFSFTSNYSTNPIPTKGGIITVSGDYLGWLVYNENNQLYNPVYPQIGNKELRFTAPEGTGLNKVIQIKFHASPNTNQPQFPLIVNYQPPSITSVKFVNPDGYVTIIGNNFGSDHSTLVTLTIAGKNFTTFNGPSSFIDSNTNLIGAFNMPYTSNITVSMGLIVDGQSTYKLIKPINAAPQLFEPLPALYVGGGEIEFPGQYLTYDSTLMTMKINGIDISNRLVQGASNYITYAYDPLPIGTYPLEFVFDGYVLSTTFEVNNIPPCYVIHGYCLGKRPVCYTPYIGPSCSSQPINSTEPLPVSTTSVLSHPDVPYFVSSGDLNSTFTYTISLKSMTEFDQSNQPVNSRSINVVSMTPSSTAEANSYGYSTQDCQFQVDWVKIESIFIASYYKNKTYNPSTLRYSMICFGFEFLQTSNYLQVTYQVDFEVPSTNVNVTSFSVINGSLPTDPDYNFVKSQLNFLSLYTKIFKICYVNGYVECEIVPQILSSAENSISLEIVAKLPSNPDIQGNIFAFEVDFSMLVEDPDPLPTTFPPGTTLPPVTTIPSNKSCKGRPTCYNHGKCINGRCVCDSGYKGEICDSVEIKLPEITNPNRNNPEVNSTSDELGLHISIYSIKELDYNGNEVRSQSFQPKWNYTHQKTSDVESFFYSYLLFSNTEVKVKVDYFFNQQTVDFAGTTYSKSPGSIKYSANITSWPFLKQTNQLQLVFLSSAKDNTESSDSCTYKSEEYSDDSNSNLKSVSIQVNDKTFMATFINSAIVDGKITIIKNSLLSNPTDQQDTNTQASVFVGINTPHHSNYLVIDPDFSLLISYVPPSEKEGSICLETSKSKKLTGSQVAGIVIGCIVFVGAIVAVTIYYIKFHKDKLKLESQVKQKMSMLNSNK